MITDGNTNMLFFADCLPVKYPRFFSQLERILHRNKVAFNLLADAKDIWAVDYMPIQIEVDEFVQFVYNPDYLRSKKWQRSITDGHKLAQTLGIDAYRSNIVLDGGNVVSSNQKVILCDKILRENNHYTKEQLLSKLRRTFHLEKVFLVPQQPGDFIGHADGMVRFIDENTVLVNDYSKEKSSYRSAFKVAIQNAGLSVVQLPYNPYENRSNTQANGIYVNYLQMERLIVLPIYEMKEDDQAIKVIESVFNDCVIETLDCNEIAQQGGVMNCITWNVQR